MYIVFGRTCKKSERDELKDLKVGHGKHHITVEFLFLPFLLELVMTRKYPLCAGHPSCSRGLIQRQVQVVQLKEMTFGMKDNRQAHKK